MRLKKGFLALAAVIATTQAPALQDDPPAKIEIVLGAARKVKMEFVRIKAGKFEMGSKEGADDEKPLHEVTISKDYWMQATEVTQAQWEAVMGSNPSHFKGADLPVEKVSWKDCQEFLKKLNEKVKDQLKGRTVGLPTEAQWEYACRAGTSTKWSFGDDEGQLDEYAWNEMNSDQTTHPVATRKPNAWGLYDMHGNVWETCEDWYGTYPKQAADPAGPATGTGRIMRGGGWNYCSIILSATRSWNVPDSRNWQLGLRAVVR